VTLKTRLNVVHYAVDTECFGSRNGKEVESVKIDSIMISIGTTRDSNAMDAFVIFYKV
jgi:hypothetical protein